MIGSTEFDDAKPIPKQYWSEINRIKKKERKEGDFHYGSRQ